MKAVRTYSESFEERGSISNFQTLSHFQGIVASNFQVGSKLLQICPKHYIYLSFFYACCLTCPDSVTPVASSNPPDHVRNWAGRQPRRASVGLTNFFLSRKDQVDQGSIATVGRYALWHIRRVIIANSVWAWTTGRYCLGSPRGKKETHDLAHATLPSHDGAAGYIYLPASPEYSDFKPDFAYKLPQRPALSGPQCLYTNLNRCVDDWIYLFI